jgi:hypothetical protein
MPDIYDTVLSRSMASHPNSTVRVYLPAPHLAELAKSP